MQNVQMSQLEDALTNHCNGLGIDPLHILVSIDANLNLTERKMHGRNVSRVNNKIIAISVYSVYKNISM